MTTAVLARVATGIPGLFTHVMSLPDSAQWAYEGRQGYGHGPVTSQVNINGSI
jgi:hypothetical protein